jgi:hypothetical protein
MKNFKPNPPPPDRHPATSREAAEWAVAAMARISQHGQRCPVWTRRGTAVDLCDCWILSNAKHTAGIALRAAAEWSPDGAAP